MDATARRGWTVRAAVVVSRDGDRIREVTVDNRGEVKVEPESERGRMKGKKGLITRKASSDLEEVCGSIHMGFANPFFAARLLQTTEMSNLHEETGDKGLEISKVSDGMLPTRGGNPESRVPA